jgi:hypothetical protein
MESPPTVDISKRVDQYVRLRDLIKTKEDEHKAVLKPYKEMLEKLNSVLLDHLNTINGESVRTDTGTVYRTEKKAASLADPDAFMRYVIGSEAWDLLDRKANVTAVSDFIEENNAPPPGVNFSTTFVVGVRRK